MDKVVPVVKPVEARKNRKSELSTEKVIGGGNLVFPFILRSHNRPFVKLRTDVCENKIGSKKVWRPLRSTERISNRMSDSRRGYKYLTMHLLQPKLVNPSSTKSSSPKPQIASAVSAWSKNLVLQTSKIDSLCLRDQVS